MNDARGWYICQHEIDASECFVCEQDAAMRLSGSGPAMDTGTMWREHGYKIGHAEGYRAALWAMAVGAAWEAEFEGCSDPMSQLLELAYSNVSHWALQALADLGDDQARSLLESGR